jgi:hypothetical protein
VREEYAEGCRRYIWSSLGKQLQRAAGVSEAELEGDGSAAAAAAAAACSSSSSREEFRREGVEVDLPADAAARLRMMWDEDSKCLFGAITLYRGKQQRRAQAWCLQL